MTVETRTQFHQRLEHIDATMVRLFAMVTEGIGAATDAVLTNNASTILSLAHQDEIIGALWVEVEETAQNLLALQGPVAGDLRFLLSVLRIAPELERSADLASHIAARGARSIGTQLSPRGRGLVDRMGGHAVGMWRKLSDGYRERDPLVAAVLEVADEEVDRLHADLTREITASDLVPTVLVDMALVARFYERLGDHAVNIARRFGYLAGAD
jgi:phosphate transport system protein